MRISFFSIKYGAQWTVTTTHSLTGNAKRLDILSVNSYGKKEKKKKKEKKRKRVSE